MKITKYYQSCLLIEEGKTRILIDPSAQETERVAGFSPIDAVLYTHEHADHFDPELAAQFQHQAIAIYANASVAKQLSFSPIIVEDGQEFAVKDILVKVLELSHCPMPDGSGGPQNTGYLFNQKLFHPGDGKELAGLQVSTLALPITGPDISPRDAFAFARQTGARRAIAIHWDIWGANAGFYASRAKALAQPFELEILGIGESTEV